jgi:hypothetical protein
LPKALPSKAKNHRSQQLTTSVSPGTHIINVGSFGEEKSFDLYNLSDHMGEDDDILEVFIYYLSYINKQESEAYEILYELII